MKTISSINGLLRNILFTGIWIMVCSLIASIALRIYMDLSGTHSSQLLGYKYIIMFMGGAGCGLFLYAMLIAMKIRVTEDFNRIKEKYK